MNEEELAARALGELLTTALLNGYNDNKTWLYSWERDGLTWLVRFKDRNPNKSYSNAWIAHFIHLNRDAILTDKRMNFNLRDNPM